MKLSWNKPLLLCLAFCLLRNSAARPESICDACGVTCNTETTVLSPCEKTVTVTCKGQWTGELCFVCEDTGEFSFGEGNNGAFISTHAAVCQPIPGSSASFPFYQVKCMDDNGNEAVITVSDPDFSSKSGKGKGGKGNRRLQAQQDEDPIGELDGRSLRKLLTQQTCSNAGDKMFNHRQLMGFDHSALYENVKPELAEVAQEMVDLVENVRQTLFRPCPHKESKYYGQRVSFHDCTHPESRVATKHDTSAADSYEHWIAPKSASAKLLAQSPGVWTIDNFLDPREVETLRKILVKNGDAGLFGECPEMLSQMSSSFWDNKKCFMMSADRMCPGFRDVPNFGPLDSWDCPHETQADEGDFIRSILDKVSNEMVTQKDDVDFDVQVNPFVQLRRSNGDVPPMMLHEDAHETITMVLYLSDAGGSTYFPKTGALISPKRGRLGLWVSVDEQGNGIETSFHGVTAYEKTSDNDDEMIAIISFHQVNKHMV